jgi:hypothetical protein
MRVAFERVVRIPRPPLWAAAIVVLWLALIGALELLRHGIPETERPSLCLVRRVTGVPCPTCGSTRAVLAAAGGHPFQAFAHNPLVVLGILFIAVWLAVRLAFSRQIRVDASRRTKRALWLAGLALVLINWGYVLWRELG